tara:strand:- start:348 stop:503 length:156 start_codon:yes stop_codon:yes gene_type:complete
MSNSSILSILGIVVGSSGYAAQNGFYSQYTGAVFAISSSIFGILTKGVEKK